MTHKVIKTEAAYQKAVKRTIAIFEEKEGTLEEDELALLLVLVKDYEDKHIQIPTIRNKKNAKITYQKVSLDY
jgi:HTH-type transcriptional regulator / antitoxin HigA